LEPDKDELLLGRQIVTQHGRIHHLDELQAQMAPCTLRRLKSDVLPDLPPKKRRTVIVELQERDMQQYRAAAKDVVAWLRQIGVGDRADSAARGQAIVKIQMLRRIAALGKLREAIPKYLRAWFQRKSAGRLVIFGYHRRVLRGVRMICERAGLRTTGIVGKDSDDRRQRSIDLFNSGQADVFVAPIRAAGVGLNLQGGSSDALFVEKVWVPTLMCQAEDRIHRLGQRHEVTITYLDAAGTVDEHISSVLDGKLSLITQIIDDTDAVERLERQTFDEVVAVLASERLT
jgi:SWI/SNF-related matrix-associated actin-dependent regulator of chromatin subfamily A-like protein 1